MSNWGAVEKGGDAISAWEYRSIFLKFGTKYDEFYCPFCDIRLAAYLIYTEGEVSKSPHFSARWEDHIYNCNGDPIVVDAPERKKPEAHYIPREMHFPEAFTNRPPPRKQRPIGEGKPLAPPSSIEVSARRKKAGSLGRPVPSTYLLQPIVETYNSVYKDGFERAKEKKWSDDIRWRWTKNTLSGMRLRLDDATNYEDAFRTPSYINSNYPRIYHNTGTVLLVKGSYCIKSKLNGKKEDTPFPFLALIGSGVVSKTSHRSHTKLLSILDDFVATEEEMRWYAYGLPRITPQAFVINIENLDFLYIKKSYSKKP
jgi:hypothetical protein